MNRQALVIAVACLLSGCESRPPSRTADIVPHDANAESRTSVPHAEPGTERDGGIADYSGEQDTRPTETVPIVELTEQAAQAVNAITARLKSRGTFYLRVIAQQSVNKGDTFDLNITRNVDPKSDVFSQSRGIQIVVSRSSLPRVDGGTVDYQLGEANSGFQFRKPGWRNQVVDPAPSQHTSPTRDTNVVGNSDPLRTLLGESRNSYRLRTSPSNWTESDPYSNIHPVDYVGPSACAECHPQQYNLWQTHPHSRMNQNASAETVIGDFSGTTMEYGDGTARFERNDGDFYMAMFWRGNFIRRYRVTRTVGSRIFQMYIGVQTEGPEPRDDSIYDDERKLPFAYWIGRKQWFPETYDEPIARTEFDENGQLTKHYGYHTHNFRPLWRESCIWCHNTYPYEARLQKRLGGFPPKDLALTRVKHPVVRGDDSEKLSLPVSDLVTIGISCESCHFGGREHVVKKREIRFVPSGDNLVFPRATGPMVADARYDPYVINSICAQCHAVNLPKFPNQASAQNSAEAIDLQSGACFGAIKCTDCHNPHRPGPAMGGGPDRLEHIEACLNCHEKYRAPGAAEIHSRHRSNDHVSCLDCHMPRIVHGLHDVIRTHQISSPTDTRMLSKGAPNACNMCHLDRSIRWTLDQLEKGWGRKLNATDDWVRWYGGSLDNPTGVTWLRHPAPMARQVAADSFSRSPLGKETLQRIVPLLNDRSPPTRMFGLFAVERILGRRIELDEYSPWTKPSRRTRQVWALGR